MAIYLRKSDGTYVRIDDGDGNLNALNKKYDVDLDGTIDSAKNADTVDGKHASNLQLRLLSGGSEYVIDGSKVRINRDGKSVQYWTGSAWENIIGGGVGNVDTVDGKHASDFAPASHKHGMGDLVDIINISKMMLGSSSIKPAAGVFGRIFFETDTHIIWYDNGVSWVKLGVADWEDINGKPSSFPPSPHASSHAIGGSDPIAPEDIGAIPSSEKGVANGVCELDANALVPLARIPAIPDSKLAFSTWKLVAQVSVTANTGRVTFGGLNIKADGAYLLFGTVKNPTTSDRWYVLYPGEDTTKTDYKTMVHWVYYDSASGSVKVSYDTSLYPVVLWVPAGNSCTFLSLIMLDANGYYRVMTFENCTNNGCPVIGTIWVACKVTVANVTSLIFEEYGATAGAIGAGSKFWLCKIKT